MTSPAEEPKKIIVLPEQPLESAYSYLAAYQEYVSDNEGLTGSPSWKSVQMGRPNQIKMADGTVTIKERFCCDGFPAQNLESFLFIPLYLNTDYRACFLKEFSAGESSPPDCRSLDGKHPVSPLNYGGRTITECNACNLHGFGGNALCRTRPAMIGLAWFPEADLLVPIRKEIPGVSAEAVTDLVQALKKPPVINGMSTPVPFWARVVKIFVELKDTKMGLVPTWAFRVIQQNDHTGAPAFVPEALLPEVQKILGYAANFYKKAEALPILTTATPPPLIASMAISEEEEAALY